MWASRSARLQPAHGVGRTRSSGVTRRTSASASSSAAPCSGRRSSGTNGNQSHSGDDCKMVIEWGVTERQDLLAALYPITRALRRIEDAAAAREGISMWQYAILSAVADRPGCNQREVAAHLQYSPNRIVADLHDLQDRGWLLRRPGADRRSNVLTVTDAGDGVRRRVRAEIHR